MWFVVCVDLKTSNGCRNTQTDDVDLRRMPIAAEYLRRMRKRTVPDSPPWNKEQVFISLIRIKLRRLGYINVKYILSWTLYIYFARARVCVIVYATIHLRTQGSHSLAYAEYTRVQE
jgi:hypothetical protein